MKLPLRLCMVSVLLVGCSAGGTPSQTASTISNPPIVLPILATKQQCEQVYARTLGILVFENTPKGGSLPPREVMLMQFQKLDEDFQFKGIREEFFRECMTTLSTQTIDCMMQATSTQGMDACDTSFGETESK